jgi:penicillin-binding protein 2
MKFILLRAVILCTFGAIAFQLFQIQINFGDTYQRLAENNRFRLLSEEAPRGVIYDRNGVILARNAPAYSIAIIPADLPDDKQKTMAMYEYLSQLLKVPATAQQAASARNANGGLQSPASGSDSRSIEELVDDGRLNPYATVTIKARIDRVTANTVEEMRTELPGVYVLREATRAYPLKDTMAHLLGYTGGIPSDLFKDYQARGYDINDSVGVSGIEQTFESDLRGGKGRRLVEVDASGREISTLAAEPALPGKNLVLTLDSYLQTAAVEALKVGLAKSKAKAGSVIALNPQNGEVLAMVSWPSYDNNLFANGISVSDYAGLIQNKDLPLYNRALSGEYPLGSIFKIVPASAALQENVIDINTGIVDSGIIWVPNKFFPNEPRLAQPFYGWSRQGLGLMNINSALAWSSDIFFYEVSGGFQDFDGLGLNRLASYALSFGFGERTGINVPGEAKGLVPTDRWKRLTYAQSWVTGDTYNMGIGQGFMLGTPLQIVNALAAVANGGTLYRPQVARALIDADSHILKQYEPEVIRKLPVSPENLAIVRAGLRSAVTSGTATAINFAAVPIAGKTGTAEYPGPRDRQGRLPTHAWFLAFAPYDNPQIALVVFVEGGGEGSTTAVPIAGDILKAYFHLPKDTPLAPDVQLDTNAVPIQPTAINESPQAGSALPPPKPPDAPKTYRVRILAQETTNTMPAWVVGWVRDRAGRPIAGIHLAIEAAGTVVARPITGVDGSFRYDAMNAVITREWHVRIEGVESAEQLTLKIEPSTKYTVLFYEE